jgi:hypothetical protein
MAAGAVIALVGIAGCGAAANPAPAFNGPYGRGGPFAAGQAGAAGPAGPAGGKSGHAVRVDGSVALDGVTGLPWLFALGAGVQVSAPSTVRAGTGTPADAAAGFYQAFYAQRFPQACGYVVPAQRPGCPARLRGSRGRADVLRTAAIGFAVEKGDQALVTMTGALCRAAAGCAGQQDPGWIFANSRTFDQLWAMTAANGGNPLTVTPLTRDAGHWYVDLTAAAPVAG